MEKDNKKKGGDNGKRKPIVDDMGLKWCNCTTPRLTRNILPEERGQAYCLKCGQYWYR